MTVKVELINLMYISWSYDVVRNQAGPKLYSVETIIATIVRRNVSIWAGVRQNLQNYLCAQRRLRSAWASPQSDQNLRFVLYLVAEDQSNLQVASEDSDQTGRMARLIWVFAGRTAYFPWICRAPAHLSTAVQNYFHFIEYLYNFGMR